jgi:hypothetical protein
LFSKLPENISKQLEEELRKRNQLPARFTWDGGSIPLSYSELVSTTFFTIRLHFPWDWSFFL